MSRTEYLKCAHVIGRNRAEYLMRCDVLKEMPDGRLKVRVYGDRNWANTDHLSRVRYVDRHRVIKNPDR